VEFAKIDDKGRLRCRWDARRGARPRLPGTTMAVGRGLPHDLAQYVIEAAAGYRFGFWDLVARGATFASTGRRRTQPGRALIAAHRGELAGAERLAGLHLALWQAGHDAEVTAALRRAEAQWHDLGDGERLVFEWPDARGRVESAEFSRS